MLRFPSTFLFTAIVCAPLACSSSSDTSSSSSDSAIDSFFGDSDHIEAPQPDTTTNDTTTTDTSSTDGTPADTPSDGSDPCTAAGGTIGTALCCATAGDYPNNCLTGSCGCSPSSSHEVKTCTCGAGKCWDGTTCRAAG